MSCHIPRVKNRTDQTAYREVLVSLLGGRSFFSSSTGNLRKRMALRLMNYLLEAIRKQMLTSGASFYIFLARSSMISTRFERRS